MIDLSNYVVVLSLIVNPPQAFNSNQQDPRTRAPSHSAFVLPRRSLRFLAHGAIIAATQSISMEVRTLAQHISIRVPWHDSGYSGNVCTNPRRNISCRCLKNIASNKNDSLEQQLAGCPMAEHEDELPCVGEGAAFMSPQSLVKTIVHPYSINGSPSHRHYLPTELRMPPYSAPARPFGWTLLSKYDNPDFARQHNIRFDPSCEPDLGFKSAWVQGRENQQRIFDSFFADVEPTKSLVFFYAKKVPFVDDSRRVIVGIGHVDRVIPAVEYHHAPDTPPTSMTWETTICHTIRPDLTGGVLFPYAQLADRARTHPGFSMEDCTVFVEDEFFENFSYASEHVTDDAAISILINALRALDSISRIIPNSGNWSRCMQWVSDRLHEAQLNRGLYPSLGGVLYAFGFEAGYSMASALSEQSPNPWAVLDMAMANPSAYFEAHVAASVTPTLQTTWAGLAEDRKAYLQLLSRVSLGYEQARALVSADTRAAAGILLSDAEALENPYLLFERTCELGVASPYRITVRQIDRALFPPAEIANACPLPRGVPAILPDDKRRMRAYAVEYLEWCASQGHTVFPSSLFLSWLQEAAIEPSCRVSSDALGAHRGYLSDVVHASETAHGGFMMQLRRLKDVDDLIERAVRKRTEEAIAHSVFIDWQAVIDAAFGPANPGDSQEALARQEKAAILEQMAASRLFVLVGGAGTGKTTLLSLLCKPRVINEGGIVCLAPTGKARVKMSEPMTKEGVPHSAYTIAQFLMERGLFDGQTGEYRLVKGYSPAPLGTVIVDECSMLTEEMLGSLMLALGRAERIILVGDPKQLPPIGAGRPFVDLVNHLDARIGRYEFPRVCSCFAELTVPRRQRSNLQIELGRLFRGDGAVFDDSLFDRIQAAEDPTIVVKKWETQDEFEKLLLDTLVGEIPLDGDSDSWGFGMSLGGEPRQSRRGPYLAYPSDMEHLQKLDDWQILTPIYGLGHGTANINHLIHERFRDTSLASFGSEGITYGDRIINSKNNTKPWVADGWRYGHNYYLANGEIGIIGRVKKDGKRCLIASFATQPNLAYDLTSGAGDFEGEPTVELAYSLTVHKVQGSGFEKVVLVMGEPCRLITRELLYTAITRQTKKLIVLYNADPHKLAEYASDRHSEIAKRLTRLFIEPTAVQVDGALYEDGLIHRTKRNELVRSKSEVVIANSLYESGVDYEYEKPLVLDGVRKVPDFTIYDAATGNTWYWEHLGMLADPAYAERWKRKREFYAAHGIVEGNNLIITRDGADGSIDSMAIQQVIHRHL